MESVILAVILALVIRIFLFEPFFIPSPSMQPTLDTNDRIIVNKIVYKYRSPRRGDVMVFKFPLDTTRDFVKRVVASGGDSVEIRHSKVYVNDTAIAESYLPPNKQMNDFGPVKIPPGYYFMMGDNRNNSEDSRMWGPLDKKLIIGKVQVIYWPPNRMGLIR
jgi:signal peptidase I